MLNKNERGRTILLKLSVVLAGTALMNSLTVATNADAQTATNAPGVPLRPTLVGRELVYPDGVMVSIDAGTGLSSNEVIGLSSRRINLDSVPRTRVIECSPGYTCLYEAANYGGRRLQWSDRPQDIDSLNAYGFNDQMTSWRNRNSVDARWYHNDNQRGTSRCMNANTSVTNVGTADNDKASSLRIYTNATTCG
jgi:hypothetical protein